jgi:hypothetical protein
MPIRSGIDRPNAISNYQAGHFRIPAHLFLLMKSTKAERIESALVICVHLQGDVLQCIFTVCVQLNLRFSLEVGCVSLRSESSAGTNQVELSECMSAGSRASAAE